MHNITAIEVADELGITHDSALKLRRKLGVGTWHLNMWWLAPADVDEMKKNCRAYQLANR